ncbi:MAG: GMC family oxidoreductase [Vicinamibacterales bacterium]
MPHFDIVIIGTGAGGGTIAHALADSGARILLVERGDFVPQEDDNWNPEAVWKHLRYQTREQWFDERGRAFRPYTHYCVGGNTKFWGSVLYRLRREDFQEMEHMDGVSPAWPIDYAALEPYYERAEQLYHVRGLDGLDPTEPARRPYPYEPVPHAEEMGRIVEQLRLMGLHPSPLPLGVLRPGETDGCILCNTCNSFACKLHAKSESDVVCVRPAMRRDNVTLWTNACARRLHTDAAGKKVVAADIERAGRTERVEAPLFIVSCGAINSAALLLRSRSDRHPEGLANSSGLVGRRYMAHLATMVSGFDGRRTNTTVFQKTVAINDFYLRGPQTRYPLGQIQSQGRTAAITLKSAAPWYAKKLPLNWYAWWAGGAVDWLVMSEDLPNSANGITVDGQDRIHLRYRPNNLRAHGQLITETKRILRKLGLWLIVKHSLGAKNTTHQCGTACFGIDPRVSVLDPYCRSHDVENLFVVDGSFFPSSAAVNPGLTIVAQALRVADHIKDRDL